MTAAIRSSRRAVLKLAALALTGAPAAGWFDRLAANVAAAPGSAATEMSCILLFMSGGPSHIDTFDPKPENKTSAFGAIDTAAPGIRFVENLPLLAKSAGDLAVLRGMSTTEADHGRARYYMHTGYRQGVGGLVHPSLGAIVSAQLGHESDVLPNFVSIDPKNTGRATGSGYAGPMHAPLEMTDPAKGLENMATGERLRSFGRKEAFGGLDQAFIRRVRSLSSEAHLATYQRAAALMRSSKIKAFDLGEEPASVRDAYGRTSFGDGCILARRLVEAGVRFVEVVLDGWDTHTDNANSVKRLSGQLDPAMSTLINDLKARGRLDSTLIVCMGEFGRSPRVEGGPDGRGHYARAWTSVLAGGGLKTGQSIGRTDKEGAEVVERPITTVDFMATICQAMKIDYTGAFTTNDGRPVRIVDKNEHVVTELF